MKKLFVSILILAFAAAFAIPSLAAGTNIAASAAWTASSEYSEKYACSLVADGVVDNRDGEEWASAGEIDPWINAEFPAEVWINKIILYDRINLSDHAVSGKITFNDGSVIDYTDLENDGTPMELTFEPKKIKSFKIEIVGADTTLNNGYAEIEIFDCDAPAAPEPAPVEETQPETQAQAAPAPAVSQVPQTGDYSTIIILSVLVVSAAVIIILNKKRTYN